MKPRAAVTTVDGLEIGSSDWKPVPLDVFRVREAVTVCRGPRGGRTRVRTAGETPAPLDAGATEPASFQVREAVTTTLPPPHWAKLLNEAEMKPVDAPAVAWEPPETEED